MTLSCPLGFTALSLCPGSAGGATADPGLAQNRDPNPQVFSVRGSRPSHMLILSNSYTVFPALFIFTTSLKEICEMLNL